MIRALFFLILLARTAVPVEAQAGNVDLGYAPPEIVNCDNLGALSVRLGSDHCLLVYAYGRLDFGYDSSAGFVWDHEARLRGAALTQTDMGGLAGVVTIASARDFYWDQYEPTVVDVEAMGGDVDFEGGGGSGFGYTDGTPRMDEAFLQFGDDIQLRAGKVKTLLNFDDDEPFDELGVGLGVAGVEWSFWPQPWLLASERGFSPSVQVTAEAGYLTFGAGLEDLTHGGSAIGVLAYDDGNTSAHLTQAFFADTGSGPAWGLHGGATTDFDRISLVAAVAYDSSGYWQGLTSGLIDLGWVELVGTLQTQATGERTMGASAAIDLGDFARLLLGVEAMRADESASHLIAGGLVLDVTEALMVTAQVGVLDEDQDGLRYGALRVEFETANGLAAVVKGTAVDQGGYKIESSIVQKVE